MPRTRAIAVSALAGAAGAVMTASIVFADDRGFGGGFGMRRRACGGFFFFPLLLLIGVVVLVVLLWRGRHPVAPITSPPPPAPVSPTLNAQAILADRLARGEINPDDYRAAVAVLRETPPLG